MAEYTIVVPFTTDLCNLKETLNSINKYTNNHEILIIVSENQKIEAEIIKTMATVIYKNSTQAKALNDSIDLAQGKYIIILKDNVLVSPDWLSKLKRTFLLPAKRPVTIVAPILSQSIFEVQNCEFNFTQDNYIKNLNENKLNYGFIFTNFISDVCLMFKKDKGLKFNETLNSGEVFDLIIRNTLTGNICAINKSAFIFDKKPVIRIEDLSSEILDIVKLHSEYFKRKQTILGILKTKIVNDFDAKIFKMSYDKLRSVVDKVLILNEGSLLPASIEGNPYIIEISKSIYDEETTKKIITKIQEFNCDWILYLKSNEVLEENVVRENIDRLVQNANPFIHGYIFQDYIFKDITNSYTNSQKGGKFTYANLFRYIPNQKITNFNMLLNIPEDSLRLSSIRYKQYIEPLKDEFIPVQRKWYPNNNIDICTIMKNERNRLFWYMNKYYGFANKIILVDTGSTDDSIEIAKLLGAEIYEVPEGSEDFAKARNIYLEKTKADWIFHVDLDEHCPDLYGIRQLSENSCKNWLFRITNPRKDGTNPTSETVRLFRNRPDLKYKGIIHEVLDLPMDEPMKFTNITLVNEGFLDDDEVIEKKVRKYFKMNWERLCENPDDYQALHTMGLFLFDDFRYELAIALINKANRLMPKFHLPKKDLAVIYLHFGKYLFKEIIDMLHPNHPDAQECTQIYKFLESSFKPRKADGVGLTKEISNEEIIKIL